MDDDGARLAQKRAPRGSGSPAKWKPAKELWEARYTDRDGRRVSVYGKSQGEAERKRQAGIARRDSGLPKLPERYTVKDCLADWLASPAVTRKRPNTIIAYTVACKSHLSPRLGRFRLQALRPADIERMLDAMLSAGKAPATAALARRVLVLAIGQAERNGYVARNVAKMTPGPSVPKPPAPITTPEEVHAILAAVADHRLAPLYRFQVGTGRRIGEALAVRWSDVDLDGMAYNVTGTLQDEKGQRVIRPTKAAASTGRFALTNMAADALKAQRAQQRRERLVAGHQWQDTGHVFTTATGLPLPEVHVYNVLRDRLALAKLPHVSVHDLRHAAATLALSEGAQLSDIQAMLGHASIATTGRYAHPTEARGRDTAERLDRALGTSAG